MKKIILSFVAVSVLSIGSAQAALVSIVDGLGMGDTFTADANLVLNDIAVTGSGTLGFVAPAALVPTGLNSGTTDEDGKTLSITDTDGAAFVHDYLFTNAADDSVNITATTSNTLLGTIDPFLIGVFVSDPLGALGEAILPITTFASGLLLSFEVAAGATYAIRLAGVAPLEGANYNFAMAVVPVPAAVWLFGTAVLGLFGMRRKQKLQAAAA